MYSMRNEKLTNTIAAKVISQVETLPYFSVDNLKILGVKTEYLHRILSRALKKGDIVRLKKGLYTSTSFVEHSKMTGEYSAFAEFASSILYRQSYLSLEYVLYEHNILTEVPVAFSAITTQKTKRFINPFGTFIYHSIKAKLFTGFATGRSGLFTINKATRAKALFDFLYLRKFAINNKESFDTLRLNLETLTAHDRKEFKTYTKEEGGKKMALMAEFICR